ncbi:hypothetical protein MCHI_002192 [Candidatus Magnetoovum chiemensis]|nr:hypothetical protein MCHI_002192 [Candidatus Magnetoovum chiemensis]
MEEVIMDGSCLKLYSSEDTAVILTIGAVVRSIHPDVIIITK